MIAATSPAVTITCSTCGRASTAKPRVDGASAKLPRGWKRAGLRDDGEPLCDTCWSAAYVIRAATLPIAEVIGDKAAFAGALNAAWRASTDAANLAVQALFRAEALPSDGAPKTKMPSTYLYGSLKGCTAMDPASLAQLLRAVEQRYRARRFDAIIRRAEGLPLYRFPVPYPLRADQFRLRAEPDGALLADMRLGGAWRTVRLRQGKEFRRIAALVRGAIGGENMAVEASLLRAPNKSWMCKVVMWVPRAPKREVSGVMTVRTASDCMIVATVEGRDPWRLNMDVVREWVSAKAHADQRMREDMKYEKRLPRSQGETLRARMSALAERSRAKIGNSVGVVSKMVAEFARRQRVAVVQYDDTDRSYMERYPWARLRDEIARKLDAHGIRMEVSGECAGGDEGSGSRSQGEQTQEG